MPTHASWLRRIAALFVDWGLSWLFTLGALGLTGGYDRDVANVLVLFVFWVASSIGTAWAGGSLGQLICRIRVYGVRDGHVVRLGLLRSFVRQFLVCLVIPPLVANSDGRGVHDFVVGSGAFEYRT